MWWAREARAEVVFIGSLGQGGSNIFVFWGSWKSNCTGVGPSERGIMRKTDKLRWKFWPVNSHFFRRDLAFLTAASARPFNSGWYGEESSWVMLNVLQNTSNSERNWGPPSVRIVSGHPRRLNQLVSFYRIEEVLVLVTLSKQRQPVNLLTSTIYSLLLRLNRSAAHSWKENAALVTGCDWNVFRFWEGAYNWHALQLFIVVVKSLSMPCQKNSCFVNLIVLSMPM